MLTLGIILLGYLCQADEGPFLSCEDTDAILAHEGQHITLYGWVEKVEKSAAGTNFIRFRNATISLVTFKSDLGQFAKGEPIVLYEGKRLAVQGVVSLYRKKPRIKLSDPAQVTLLAADAVFPPLVATNSDAKASPPEPQTSASVVPQEVASEKRKPTVAASEYFKKPQSQ